MAESEEATELQPIIVLDGIAYRSREGRLESLTHGECAKIIERLQIDLFDSRELQHKRAPQMAWKIMVVASLDVGVVAGPAITSQVIEFETREAAEQAIDAVRQHDDDEENSYVQLEAMKLF